MGGSGKSTRLTPWSRPPWDERDNADPKTAVLVNQENIHNMSESTVISRSTLADKANEAVDVEFNDPSLMDLHYSSRFDVIEEFLNSYPYWDFENLYRRWLHVTPEKAEELIGRVEYLISIS
jgi:hypothetical protein